MLTNSIIDDIKYQFRFGNMVIKLILANVAVFVAFSLFNLFSFLFQANDWYQFVLNKAQVPAAFGVLLHQPWTVVTYMFLHTGFFHILFNMLWLYWFGEIFTVFLSDKKILPLYILGGLSGAAAYIVAFNLIPALIPYAPGALMMGASASVFAIVFAAATLSPDYELNLILIGPIKIKYIALVALLLGVISIPSGNAGGNIAHVGGALCGYFYIKGLQNGISSPFTGIMNKLTVLFRRRARVKVVHKNVNYKTEPPRARTDDDQQKLDTILDKISRSGYDSLTNEERDFLFHYSKK